MKVFKALLCIIILGVFVADRAGAADRDTRSILVAYFSHTNNTRQMAETIHSRTGGVLFPIVPRTPYPREHRETEKVSRNELNNNLRPELAATLSAEEMDSFDTIFIGFPNWWNTMPMVITTFLEQYDLAGKTVIPFCTHGGSGLGGSIRDLARIAPNATMLQGLAIHHSSLDTMETQVNEWLRQIELMP